MSDPNVPVLSPEVRAAFNKAVSRLAELIYRRTDRSVPEFEMEPILSELVRQALGPAEAECEARAKEGDRERGRTLDLRERERILADALGDVLAWIDEVGAEAKRRDTERLAPARELVASRGER